MSDRNERGEEKRVRKVHRKGYMMVNRMSLEKDPEVILKKLAKWTINGKREIGGKASRQPGTSQFRGVQKRPRDGRGGSTHTLKCRS